MTCMIIFCLVFLAIYFVSGQVSPLFSIKLSFDRLKFKISGNDSIQSSAQSITHLWSLRLADDAHFRLTKAIPCRTIEYTGGPKKDPVNSCADQSINEFSVENTIKAQQWLFNHQHPSDCSNKRFAIIRKYAWSGFGSTVHQIVWAFGIALAEDRIAVYETPGHWVRHLREDNHLTFHLLSSMEIVFRAIPIVFFFL